MLIRPTFRPHLHVEIVPDEGIALLSETDHVVLAQPLYARVAACLDGHRTADEIVVALSRQTEAAAIRRVLDDLERRGLLMDAAIDAVSAGEAAFWASHGVDPGIAKHRLAASAVSVDAVGDVAPTPYLEAFRFAGVRVAADAPRRVVITDDYLRPDLLRFNQEALSGAREWLLMKPSGVLIWLGPVFRPGRTACWECLAERLRTNRTVENFVAQRTGEVEPVARARSITAMGEQIGAGIAASTVAAWVARNAAPELDGALVTLDLRSWRSETHRVVVRPQCRACGDPPEVVAAAARPIVLASRHKTFTLDGGHRTRTPEATLERFQHHVSPISGIVPSLARSGTPHDSVVHAYIAGANPSRPLRTLAMLGEGLRSRIGGKGASDAQARASALCEALERYSGVFQGDEPRRQARLGELGAAAIHPNACMGFSDRQYRQRAEWNERGEMTRAVPLPFEENEVISWTPVWSLSHGETRYLPTAFCFYDYPLLPEAAFCIACSNGNAAGNTIEEAILQGLFELVERDSVALWWYSRAQRPAVAVESFDEPYVQRVKAYLAERGRDLAILDLTADLGIPVFAAVSRWRDRHPEQIVLGFGAHLDPSIALLRAVAELNQMLMRVLWQVAEPAAMAGEPSVREWLETASLVDHPHLVADPVGPPRRAADFAHCWSDDLRDDIRYCQRLLERRGMELLVLDQTRADVGLPAVKVIVPGLRHFWPRFAPGRLYEVPVELGWIARQLSEAELNPIAMFL